MSIQQRLKYLKQSAKRREHRGIISSILLNFKTSIILLLIFYFLFPGFHLAFAGGKVYWTENGILLSDESGVSGLVDDMRGGAITITVVWPDTLYAVRVDRNGNLPWGVNGKLLDSLGNLAGDIRAVSDGRGGAIVTWARGIPGLPFFYQRIDSLGERAWGPVGMRVTLSDSFPDDPAVVSDGAGGIIITWYEYWNWDADIYAQRIDSGGNRLWGDYGVSVCTADSGQTYPAITCDSAGNSVIAWDDVRNGEYDVYAQRLDNTGLPLWQLNGIAVCDTNDAQGFTAVIVATDTTIIVSWSDKRSGNWDVYAQSLDATGLALWTFQGIPICDTVNDQRDARPIPDGKGGAVFCWVDERNGFKNIYAQRLNSNGQRLWTHQGVEICNTDSAYWYQRIVSDGNSGAIICWQDGRSGDWDIYAQHVDSSGTVLWDTNGMPVCVVTGNQQYQEMIASDSGTAIIVWTGPGGGYAQKVGDIIVGISEKMQDARYKIQDVRLQVHPNPFSEKTDIRYMIQDAGFTIKNISLKIYDVSGKLVRTYNHSTNQQSQINQIIWNGRDENNRRLPSGIYFCQLTVGRQYLTKKLILLR